MSGKRSVGRAPGARKRAERGVAVAEWSVGHDRQRGARQVEEGEDVRGVGPERGVLLRVLEEGEERRAGFGPERTEAGERGGRRRLERRAQGGDEEDVDLARGRAPQKRLAGHGRAEPGERVKGPVAKVRVRQEREDARRDLGVPDVAECLQRVDLQPEVPFLQGREQRGDRLSPAGPAEGEEKRRTGVRVPFPPRGGFDGGHRLRSGSRAGERRRGRDPHVGGRVLERAEEDGPSRRAPPHQEGEAGRPVTGVVVVGEGHRARRRHARRESATERGDGPLPNAVVLVFQERQEDRLGLLTRDPPELTGDGPSLGRVLRRGPGGELADTVVAHPSPFAASRSTSRRERNPDSSATIPRSAPRPGGGGATRSAGQVSTPSIESTRSAWSVP